MTIGVIGVDEEARDWAIVVRNDPRGQLGQFIFVSLIFTVVWVVGFTLGRKFAEADEAKERATRAEREREARARCGPRASSANPRGALSM